MVMAKRARPTPKFMKYSGSIQGPADLSSQGGFSLVVERKSEVERSPKFDRKKTAASRVSTVVFLTTPIPLQTPPDCARQFPRDLRRSTVRPLPSTPSPPHRHGSPQRLHQTP